MHSVNPISSLWDEDHELPAHRIRHISGISIRNLTPFPKRDTVASTLSSHLTSVASKLGLEGAYIPDDADLVLSKRRTRKISSTSVVTLRAVQQQQHAHQEGGGQVDITYDVVEGSPNSTRARRTTKVRPSLTHVSATPALNGVRRGRSNSQASMQSTYVAHTSPTRSPVSPSDSFFPNHFRGQTQASSSKSSQRALEKVVSTRLVETLVTMSMTPQLEGLAAESIQNGSRSSSPSQPRRGSLALRKGNSISARPSILEEHRRSPSAGSSKPNNLQRPAQGSAPTPSSRLSRTSSSAASLSPSSSPSLSFPSSNSTLSSSRPSSPPSPSSSSTPFYVSPLHSPSTNPSWISLDPENEFCLGEGSQSTKTSITLWAHLEGKDRKEAWMQAFADCSGKGKGKEREQATSPPDVTQDTSWQQVHTWDIDLAEAQRLTRELEDHPYRIPPNTLVVSLAPTNEWYWFPPSVESHDTGHISDGDETKDGKEHLSTKREAQRRRSGRETKSIASAGLQDLVRLVTLESVLADTIASKDAVVQTADEALLEDRAVALRREAGQRELYLDVLRDEHTRVTVSGDQIRDALFRRREELKTRRKLLQEARALMQQDQDENLRLKSEVIDNQSLLRDVLLQLSTRRTALIRTIDFIFPIEPMSSGDLLFSILEVPLPLPTGPSDPAPPLILSTHPSLNENTVGSALGYASQVVQLVATYLGRVLPYPVTYAASRSLVKDPISTMQGPRMFPLFPTGVETYRFEYAVFLLNKDIEILLTERNLRAMDMRHTLPNIKNLLLTLSNGSSEEPQLQRREPSTATITDVKRAPLSPLSASGSLSESSAGSAGGTTSPSSTYSDITPRRQFLSPLAAVLRSRYANTIRQAVASQEAKAASPVDEATQELPPANGSSQPSESDAEGGSASLASGDIATAEPVVTDGPATAETVGEEQDDEDAKTERGVKIHDSDAESIKTPTDADNSAKATSPVAVTPSGDGYGGILSSFFRRGTGKRDVEKSNKAIAVVAVGTDPPVPPSVHNVIS